jgi:ribonucleotide monophosphatase NagD (HAD superfamily)
VTWVGKPYPAIYREAVRLIGNPSRVLCVGDSAEHDVAGGRTAGLTTLLVMTGVSAGLDPDRVVPQPDFWMPQLQW